MSDVPHLSDATLTAAIEELKRHGWIVFHPTQAPIQQFADALRDAVSPVPKALLLPPAGEYWRSLARAAVAALQDTKVNQ